MGDEPQQQPEQSQQPQQPEAWELPLWWVVATAIGLWLIGGVMLLVYLLGPRNN